MAEEKTEDVEEKKEETAGDEKKDGEWLLNVTVVWATTHQINRYSGPKISRKF